MPKRKARHKKKKRGLGFAYITQQLLLARGFKYNRAYRQTVNILIENHREEFERVLVEQLQEQDYYGTKNGANK